MVPSKIIVVPNDYYKNLNEYKIDLKEIYDTFLGFPDGVNITINSIKTDPIIFIDENIKNDILEYDSQDNPIYQITTDDLIAPSST